MKKINILFLFGLFSFGMVQAQVSGTIGGSIFWTFDEGVLSLDGSDEIPNNFFGMSNFVGISKGDVREVVINSGFTGIQGLAFYSTGINSISIPPTVTKIDTFAFILCDGLTSITVHEDNPVFYSDDGVLINGSNKMLVAYPFGRSGSYTICSRCCRA